MWLLRRLLLEAVDAVVVTTATPPVARVQPMDRTRLELRRLFLGQMRLQVGSVAARVAVEIAAETAVEMAQIAVGLRHLLRPRPMQPLMMVGTMLQGRLPELPATAAAGSRH